MQPSQRRLITLIGCVVLLLIVSALLYMVGMARLEGESRGFWRSLEWAAETLTTTGYGQDATWRHPVMVIFVISLQFIGLFLLFLLFPIYLIPALEERFERRLPEKAPPVHEAVLVYRYGPAVADLCEELERAGTDTVIVESDETAARHLLEREKNVVYSSGGEAPLGGVKLEQIKAIVANGNDDQNAAITLAARQAGFAGEILAVVAEPEHRKALTLAGANRVFTPRHILAAALAARASDRISPRVHGAQALGRKLVVTEMKIGPSSPLAGKSLKEADVGRRTGVNVIGQWKRGELLSPLPADTRLDADSIVIVAGSRENVTHFAETCTAGGVRHGRPFFVAGYGEVGRTASELLASVGEEVTTLDQQSLEGVTIVGDIADHQVLEKSGVREAQSVILAVGSDSATLFATLVVKDFAPDVPIIARVNDAANVERIHRAGADFALSISQVSGQLLAARLLGRESISIDRALRILKATTEGFEGRHPANLGIRETTGASVVAVERADEILVALGSDFRFEEDDVVYICGSDEATQHYLDVFPS